MCGLCKLAIVSPGEVTVDHIIPKSRGGPNRVDNLQPAHERCNQLKQNNHVRGIMNPWEMEKKDEQKTVVRELGGYANHTPSVDKHSRASKWAKRSKNQKRKDKSDD